MAYLNDNPPARSQFRSPRRKRPTGLIVVHTAESVMDSVGPDTGAEAVARFIRDRSTPGSYHDLVDSDSGIQLVRYGDEAYQDGTGSNPYALSISFALRAADWPKLSADRRDAFLRQGAAAFKRQQEWLRLNGYPQTPLRRINRALSENREAGFISHGDRDPGRRSDPGAQFPWDRFFELCGGAPAPAPAPHKPAPAPSTTVEVDMAQLPVLREGSRGNHVKILQHLLMAHNHDLRQEGGADGVFGPGVKRELTAFQRARGLGADGIAGKATWTKLVGA